MPICVACGSFCQPPLCMNCRNRLHPGGTFLLDDLPGRFALHHSGTGRLLVHQLKYNGVVGAANVLARLMAAHVPGNATAIIPLPRARARRIWYGVDPSLELAKRVGAMAGIPLRLALSARLWWPSHAGRNREQGAPDLFRAAQVPRGAVLVDDVVTSGATVRSAVAAVGNPPPGHIASVISATSPGMIVESKAPIALGRLRVGKTARQS